MADGGHVHPDLMGPATFKGQFEQCGGSATSAALHHRVRRARCLPGSGDGHLGGGARRAPDGCLHLAPVVRYLPGHQGQITALHRPGGQLTHQVGVSVGAPGDDEQTRGPLVESVHDTGPVRSTHAVRHQLGQVGEPRQQPPDERALVVPRSGVHHQTGWLVHHRDVPVGVDHFEHHTLVGADCGLADLRQPHREHRPFAEHGATDPRRLAVQVHSSGRDQLGGGGS